MTIDGNPDEVKEQPQLVQSAPPRNPSVESEPIPSRSPWTISFRIRRGEIVRLLMVLLLFAAFIITLVWSFLSANGPHWNNVKELLDLIFPAETALLGTAIAFYMTDSGGGGGGGGGDGGR